MWIKFRKQEKFIEFGKKRGSGDPLYDVINNLRIAMNNLKEEIIKALPDWIKMEHL